MNILVGILTGATASMGLGGGFILLVYLSVFTEIPQDIAQGINLLFFLPIALLSLVIHIKNKLTDLKLVGKYLILGLPCAVVGSYVAGITDVAADLGFSNEYNHQFWKEFRKVVKEANPNAIILAEHYGDAKSWLRGDEWDTVMNYDAFMEPLTWFFTGMEKHSDEFRGDLLGNEAAFTGAMRHHMASFLAPSLQVAMNELSNHDHSRFLTRTNHKVGRVANLGYEAASQDINVAVMREAVVMQMTWPGAPTIYYGDEAGVCGFTDPDNRRTYPWGEENHDLITFHKEMIRIHKACPVLTHGSLKFLEQRHNVLSYGRFSQDEQMVVAFNNDLNEQTITLSVWQVNVPQHNCKMERLMLTHAQGYTTEQYFTEVHGGKIELTLPPLSGIVLRHGE